MLHNDYNNGMFILRVNLDVCGGLFEFNS